MPILALLLVLLAPLGAAVRPPAPLADFAGIYAYRDGLTVALVPKRQELVAVIDETTYKLRRVGGDEFRNGEGRPVRFVRGERG